MTKDNSIHASIHKSDRNIGKEMLSPEDKDLEEFKSIDKPFGQEQKKKKNKEVMDKIKKS